MGPFRWAWIKAGALRTFLGCARASFRVVTSSRWSSRTAGEMWASLQTRVEPGAVSTPGGAAMRSSLWPVPAVLIQV